MTAPAAPQPPANEARRDEILPTVEVAGFGVSVDAYAWEPNGICQVPCLQVASTPARLGGRAAAPVTQAARREASSGQRALDKFQERLS